MRILRLQLIETSGVLENVSVQKDLDEEVLLRFPDERMKLINSWVEELESTLRSLEYKA